MTSDLKGEVASVPLLRFHYAMHCKMSACPSVYLSVTHHTSILSKWLNISSSFFHCQVATPF